VIAQVCILPVLNNSNKSTIRRIRRRVESNLNHKRGPWNPVPKVPRPNSRATSIEPFQ